MDESESRASCSDSSLDEDEMNRILWQKFQEGDIEILPEEITFISAIATGTFGMVYKGRCRGMDVAVKVPKKQALTEREIETLKKEAIIMRNKYHPNLILLMGVCLTPGKISIVTELCESKNLQWYVIQDKENHTTLSKRIIWAKEMAQAVAWLHGGNPVIHRDLKLPNCLVDISGHVKVADFGLSEVKGEYENRFVGSPYYMAPEVLSRQGQATEKVDVYSMAILLWEIITRTLAYRHYGELEEFKGAICDRNERPPIPESILPEITDLLNRAWHHDPAIRPSAEQMVDQLEAIILIQKERERKDYIRECIPDKDGAKLWMTHFFEKDEVSFGVFFQKLKTLLGSIVSDAQIDYLEKRNNNDKKQRELFQEYHSLKTLLARHGSNVALVDFGKFLGWFGPVGRKMLQRVVSMAKHPFFHGFIPKELSENKLVANMKPGSFLVRLSNTYPNCYIISRVDKGDSRILHHKIHYNPTNETFRLEKKIYSSFDDLISTACSTLKLKRAVGGSDFSWIFSDASMQEEAPYL